MQLRIWYLEALRVRGTRKKKEHTRVHDLTRCGGVEQTALTAYQGGSRPGGSFLTRDIFASFLLFWSLGRGGSQRLGKGRASEVAWSDLHRCFSWG